MCRRRTTPTASGSICGGRRLSLSSVVSTSDHIPHSAPLPRTHLALGTNPHPQGDKPPRARGHGPHQCHKNWVSDAATSRGFFALRAVQASSRRPSHVRARSASRYHEYYGLGTIRLGKADGVLRSSATAVLGEARLLCVQTCGRAAAAEGGAWEGEQGHNLLRTGRNRAAAYPTCRGRKMDREEG